MFSLQNYTTYSILSGIKEPVEWVSRAKELGYEALGVCDKQSLAGLLDFQKECQQEDIQPIFGTEVSVVDDTTVEDKKNGYKNRGTLLLYIKNETGLENLITLNNYSQDNRKGFYYRAYIDLNILEQYSEGLVCVLPANQGYMTEFPTKLTEGALSLHQIFGDDFYVGYNPFHIEHEELLDLPFQKVFTFNCHYPEQKDANLYEVVRNIDHASGRGKHNLDRDIYSAHLPSHDEVVGSEIDQECFNSLEEIKEKCRFEIPTGTYYMPEVELQTGSVEQDVLMLIGEGFKKKILDSRRSRVTINAPIFDKLESLDQLDDFEGVMVYNKMHPQTHERIQVEIPVQDYVEQLKYEFETIKGMGYLKYFLIIWDICRYADSLEIAKGVHYYRAPGRGSAAGSLFSYMLNITRIDPLRHGLLFERFLNPDRIDLPDIDLDFPADVRDRIKEYIGDKYGHDKVCQIGTFDRLKIASAVKAVARAYSYGIPDNDGEIVMYSSGKLDSVFSNQFITQTARGKDELEERLEYHNFKEFYNKHSNWFDDVIMPLQESIMNTSIHAAGTLITPESLDKCVPVFNRGGGDVIISQWKDRHCESRGFPKFDILSIKALDIVNYAQKMIQKRHGVSLPNDEEIDLNDPDTLALFKEAKTDGVHQFKSFAQHDYLPRLSPDSFDELVAATALVRPGPQAAEADQKFIDLKFGRKEVEFEHPDLESITGDTKGLIIFQEQIMKICQVIAGMSASEADYVRKACGKKKIDQMKKWQEVFKEGALENGYTERLADDLWDKIVAFAAYGFNIAHAVSYVKIGYYQAWIKAHYPAEFWSAVLKYATTQASKYESVFNLKSRAEQEQMSFIWPNIFGFASDFEPASDHEIYWTIHSLKGIGDKVADALTDGGKRNHFESIKQMLEECDSAVHKGIYNKLIAAGFFDPVYPKPWEAAEEYYRLRAELQGKKDDIPYDLSHKNMFKWLKERNDAFGLRIQSWKDSPAPFHRNIRRYTEDEFKEIPKGEKVFIGGEVVDIRIRSIKNKPDQFYARIRIEDNGESFIVMCWPGFWMNKDLDHTGNRPEKGQLVELIGEKDVWSPEPGRDYHQVVVNSPGDYVRIVWDEYEQQL